MVPLSVSLNETEVESKRTFYQKIYCAFQVMQSRILVVLNIAHNLPDGGRWKEKGILKATFMDQYGKNDYLEKPTCTR